MLTKLTIQQYPEIYAAKNSMASGRAEACRAPVQVVPVGPRLKSVGWGMGGRFPRQVKKKKMCLCVCTLASR